MIRIASEFSRSLLRRGRAASSEGGAQTGHRGAMSYSGLVADANQAQARGEQFFDQVIFFIVERRSAQMSDGFVVHHGSGRPAFSTKLLFAALPQPVGDHVHRRLEVEVFPLADLGRRYFTFVSRLECVVSSKLAAPFGHRCPREIGEAGSPSMEISLFPL